MHSSNNVWLAVGPILMSLSLLFNVPCSLRDLPYTLSPNHRCPWNSRLWAKVWTLEFTRVVMRLGILKAFNGGVGLNVTMFASFVILWCLSVQYSR